MIKVSVKKREISDTIWTVIETFNFCEVKYNEAFYEESKKEPGKYYYFENDSLVAVNSKDFNDIAKAELASLAIEIAVACGIEDAKIKISDEKVKDLLVLYGFENIISIDKDINGFALEADDTIFATGNFPEGYCEMTFNISKFIEIIGGYDSHINMASLIFAEKNAEGYAYDVAYNLRLNGCVIEYYTSSGTIDDAEKYADDMGINCVLRVYDGGKLLIKDFAKNEIIETSVEDFLGYYDEDEEECDCGCGGHHHHHDEDCGMH